jgi:hypothetical protein
MWSCGRCGAFVVHNAPPKRRPASRARRERGDGGAECEAKRSEAKLTTAALRTLQLSPEGTVVLFLESARSGSALVALSDDSILLFFKFFNPRKGCLVSLGAALFRADSLLNFVVDAVAEANDLGRHKFLAFEVRLCRARDAAGMHGAGDFSPRRRGAA